MGNRAGGGAGAGRGGSGVPQQIKDLFGQYSDTNITALLRKGDYYTQYDKGRNKPTEKFKFYDLDVKLPNLVKNQGRRVLIVDGDPKAGLRFTKRK